MREALDAYHRRLEDEIRRFMANREPNEMNAAALTSMLECREKVEHAIEHCDCDHAELDHATAEKWVASMVNTDGTHGAHWSITDTTHLAKNVGVSIGEEVSDVCWWVAVNMMYSDYYHVARRHGVATNTFFADMAKAFLFDEDAPSPREKLTAYYNGIARR